MLKFIILLFTLLISINSYAQWFDAQGTAQIKHGDVSTARNNAIDDALRQAMLESGSFITTEQEVINGTISKDSFNLSSSNDVKQYTLVSERQENGFITVQIRVFIDNPMNMCLGEAYPKNVMPVLFTYDLKQYQESSYGLTDFNTEFTRVLTSKLSNKSRINTLPYYNRNLGIDPLKFTPNDIQLNNTLIELTSTNDAQFIIIGVIRDITLHEREGMFNSLVGNKDRELEVSIYLYNALTNTLIYSNDYNGSAPWDDKIYTSKSSTFWQSAYGKLVQTVVNRISNDVEKTLTCLKPTGKIIEIQSPNEFYINLGKKNGIKQGSRFYIDQNASFNDNNGTYRHHKERNKITLEAIRVDTNSTLVKPIDKTSGNIQINDFVYIE
jgi:hypothetical protein